MNRGPVLLAAVALFAYGPASPGTAQVPDSVPQGQVALIPGDTVMATPFGRYDASGLHRWVMGNGHRDLWGLAVPAPVLDLERFAGGLTPTRVGGGLQTRSLRFDGADGVEYGFRSIDKDAARTLDPELRRTLAADVVQDQIAALFPLSAMVVAPLLDAAGVLHPDPRLFVLPDDPRLAEFREEFAGMLGWIEVRPNEGRNDAPGFAGSERIVSTETLLDRLEERFDNQVDAPAFLRARLLDFLVGDWDRHPDQWRWAGFRDENDLLLFAPIPRDRDWALARLDGMVARFTFVPWPHYVGFSHDFPSAFRLSWSGRALDRRLLSSLPWERWEEIADELEGRLTDEVVRDAVRRLPDSYYERIGAELEAALLNRRTGLRRKAREFYELLSGWVDIHVTDDGDLGRLERHGDGRLTVEVYDLRDGEPRPQPFFRRTFLPEETREVRLDMHGGDDRIEVVGTGPHDITLRITGGGDDDRFEDRTSGRGVFFYDHQGDNEFALAGRARIDESDWDDPVDPDDNTHRAGSRDWGARWLPLADMAYDPDLGVVIGGGAQRVGYGFRQYPYASRLRFTAALGTTTGRARAMADLDVPLRGNARAQIELFATGAGADRFYGFGNETPAPGPLSDFEARRQEYRLGAFLSHSRPQSPLVVRGGLTFEAFRPLDNPGTVVEEQEPYGYADFDQMAVTASLAWDVRDDEKAPRHGSSFRIEGRWAPKALDIEDDFGGVRFTGATYFSDDDSTLRPSLALRIGAEKLWGTFPYYEAAFIGGRESLRGFPKERFAGDASLYTGAELRLLLTHFVFILPGDLGLFGLADLGRVFQEGEDSDRWHSAVGGGLWIDWVDTYTVSAALARGDETSLYLALGLQF